MGTYWPEIITKITGMEDYLTTFEFIVDDSIGESRLEEIMTNLGFEGLGSLPPSQSAGYSHRLFLNVHLLTSNRTDAPERITFDGKLQVRNDEIIRAIIPAYEILKPIKHPSSPNHLGGGIDILIPRRLGLEEKAIEIAVLSDQGNVVNIERSVDYHKVVEEVKKFLGK